jgi:hypothetical protein
MTMIHDVKSIELTEANSQTSQSDLFWTRKLTVIDNNGNETHIFFIAGNEESIDIKVKI